eukprot:CAMPEP_0168612236 /NCGR_PEP_ID=MMETSP0449_2-20121227/2801_1 /TAXON_ID=1082188 /ORGANISM="Strombidium rassoulzadegani, Strain ras09" /LENGTH=106 /DNA_ID=CAMNT_0008652771 /DNA_START=249 /DNA_END=571 /DNA_ORIENTATION=+
MIKGMQVSTRAPDRPGRAKGGGCSLQAGLDGGRTADQDLDENYLEGDEVVLTGAGGTPLKQRGGAPSDPKVISVPADEYLAKSMEQEQRQRQVLRQMLTTDDLLGL